MTDYSSMLNKIIESNKYHIKFRYTDHQFRNDTRAVYELDNEKWPRGESMDALGLNPDKPDVVRLENTIKRLYSSL